jgi:hypothetical protein
LRRFFCPARERWNQNFTSSTPSAAQHGLEAVEFGQALVEARLLDAPESPVADRLGIPVAEKDADLALGRQGPPEAPQEGRSRSSSVGLSKACTSMWRGSIHSLSRFTVSPRPAPSMPLIRITVAKPLFLQQLELGIEQIGAQTCGSISS